MFKFDNFLRLKFSINLDDMSVMDCPDLKQVWQEFFNQIVEDFSIDDKSLRWKRFDRVMKKKLKNQWTIETQR